MRLLPYSWFFSRERSRLRWITTIESQLRENDGLRANLEEKSDQLDRLREIDYDIVTRTYEIDKIQEFLETIEEDRLDKVGWRKRKKNRVDCW